MKNIFRVVVSLFITLLITSTVFGEVNKKTVKKRKNSPCIQKCITKYNKCKKIAFKKKGNAKKLQLNTCRKEKSKCKKICPGTIKKKAKVTKTKSVK